MKRLPCYMVMIFILTPVFIQANNGLETPIVLPKTEGYNSKSFSEARRYFKRAQSLAKQFRDPGLGIVSFNLGLALHKLNLHENAVKAFLIAKKYARGNDSILNSKLLRFHECGFNPSIPCEEKPPAKMHIEGSD